MKRLLIIFSTIFMLTLLTSCGNKQEEQAPAVFSSQPESSNIVEAYGVIESDSTKDIILDFRSEIKEIHVLDGEKVKRGDPLISLNIDEYKAEIDKKETELNIARLQLRKMEECYSIQDSEVNKLTKMLKEKETQYNEGTHPDIAIKNFSRESKLELLEKEKETLVKQETLYKSGAISKAELDKEIKEVTQLKNEIRSIELSLQSLKNTLKDEIDQIKIQIDQRRSELGNYVDDKNKTRDIEIQKEKIAILELDVRLMKEKLNKSYLKENTVVCDVEEGVVFDITCSQGGYNVSSEKLFSIIDCQSVIVNADVPEEFIKDIKIGNNATIYPFIDKTKALKGKVTNISAKAVEKNGDTIIPVKITIEEPESLIIGVNVDVKIEIE